MTDSRFKLHDRIDKLTGELKAAEKLDRLNAQELADKEHALRLAQEAKGKSEAHIARITQELREAGQAYSEAVLALYERFEAEKAAAMFPNAIFNGVDSEQVQ